MMMQLKYAEEFLTKGRAGHWVVVSITGGPVSGIVAIEDLEDYYQTKYYLGSQLKDGKLQVDEKGYVHFKRVKPIIDENTRFQF